MLWNAWFILCESAVFILVGFFLAGVLEIALTGERAIRLLSGNRSRSVFWATLIGVPLPLCSCSVLPTALTLRRKGASKGATLAFLISTPETGVTSILLTYALLGPVMAVVRPIAACLTALTAGLIENARQRRAPAEEPPHAGPAPAAGNGAGTACGCGDEPAAGGVGGSAGRTPRFRIALRYAFVDLFDDIFGWIVLGIAVAAAIQVWLPPEVLQRILGGPLQSSLLMVLIGVPLYVCAEASTPIAAVLIAQGMNPGAALVLLLVGPATNIGSLGVLRRELGLRTIIVYLGTIIVVALLLGAALNDVLAGSTVQMAERALEEPFVPSWLKSAGAAVFLAMGAGTLRRRRAADRAASWIRVRAGLPVSTRAFQAAVFVLVVGAYLACGFFTVRAGEVALVRRFGAVQRTDVLPGLHYALPYPVNRIERVRPHEVRRLVLGWLNDPAPDASDNSDPDESWNLVGDENIADLKSVVQWGVDPEEIVLFQYGVGEREELVRNVVLAATREVLGGATINTAFTAERRDHEQAIERLAQQRLDEYGSGIRLRAFHILDAHAPPEVHAAFRDVASALEDRSTLINQARAQEARLIPEARGEAGQQIARTRGAASEAVLLARGRADRFLAVQEAYQASPEVTGRRLELEMMEKVLPRLRKYLRPPGDEAGEMEIWFLQPGAAGELSRALPPR